MADSSHRSRLSKLRAEEERLGKLKADVERGIAQFSVTPFGGSPYHAAQSTRLRQFTGDYLFGNRPQPEEKLLRPYDRATIIARTRIMIRNNPWLAAIFLAYVQEIGTPTYKSNAILGTPAETTAYNDARDRAFERWARDCESGDDLSLGEVIEIWGFESAIAGEMFIVNLRTGELQLIPAELCGSEKSGEEHLKGALFTDGAPVPAGARECEGKVRLNGRVIAYRFGQRDEESAAISFAAHKSSLVRREYVRHLYDRDRVEQSSGVPKVCSMLTKFQDLYETTDARAQQVKNSACLSMWITKNIDPYGFADAMRGAMRTGQVQDAVALKQIAEQRSSYGEVRAGAVYVGAPGEDVRLIEPKLNAADWIEYYIGVLQVCCKVLDGMPVEVGIEGFRRSSYSSARATMNQWKRNVVRRRARNELKLLDPIQVWQSRRYEIFGLIPKLPAKFAAQIEECYWGWPAIPDIDGAKTAAQNAVELANGSTTLQIIAADKGLHADLLTKQRAAEKIDFILALADQAEARLGLSRERAIAYAMGASPDGDKPALSALLADAFAPEPAPAPKGKSEAPPSE